MDGWVCINRKLTEHWLWEDKPFSKGQAWLDLILMANHKDAKFPLGGEFIFVPTGSFITSELKLMERWGWSKSKVRLFLSQLQNDTMIVKKSDHKKTTLTIVNYGIYQDIETTEEPKKNRKKTIDRPLKNTNNNNNILNNNILLNKGYVEN
jgi:DNA replication protein DnaD